MTDIPAFDPTAVHAGNHGLTIDHDAVSSKARKLIDSMTRTQRINEIRGLQADKIDDLYYAGGDAELSLGPWKMVDGPRGVRAGLATAFPVPIARAATFDVMLERRVGLAAGEECLAKGGNVLLAPCINLLRHPGWGRAQEAYSEDTYLTGAMGVAFVSGCQNFVPTSPKHFALNNLENTRFELSSDVDARTLHEVYLPHFERCLMEGAAASVMSAYNKVNGTYCGENAMLLTDVLRERWGYTGFVESDWFLGVYTTSPSIKAGLNIEMPFGRFFSDKKIAAAIESGELSDDDLADAAYWSVYQKLAWQIDGDSVAGRTAETSVIECRAHRDLAREAAEKSMVLLKNSGNVLPLDRAAGLKVAVVGDLADTVNLGDRGSSMVNSTDVVTPLAGLKANAGASEISYLPSDASFEALADCDVAIVVAGLTYLDEGEFIPSAQQQSEGDNLARGGDRARLELPVDQIDLIRRAAAIAKRTVVVLQGGSAIVVSDWLASVEGLVMAWYGGCEGGDALGRVLFGDAEPGGRLPVSIPRQQTDLMDWDTTALTVPHDLLHGYRWLDAHQKTAEFCFGYGLGYSRFELSDLEVERADGGFAISVAVQNVGDRAGAAVPQLYVSVQGSKVMRVPVELKGFGRLELDAGDSARMRFDLTDADLCYFDVDTDDFALELCDYVFRVGQNQAELPLQQRWRLGDGGWSAAGEP